MDCKRTDLIFLCLLLNRMQDITYQSCSHLSANTSLNVNIFLVFHFPLSDTDTSIPRLLYFTSSCFKCVKCPWNESPSPECSGLVPLPRDEEAWGGVKEAVDPSQIWHALQWPIFAYWLLYMGFPQSSSAPWLGER